MRWVRAPRHGFPRRQESRPSDGRVVHARAGTPATPSIGQRCERNAGYPCWIGAALTSHSRVPRATATAPPPVLPIRISPPHPVAPPPPALVGAETWPISLSPRCGFLRGLRRVCRRDCPLVARRLGYATREAVRTFAHPPLRFPLRFPHPPLPPILPLCIGALSGSSV